MKDKFHLNILNQWVYCLKIIQFPLSVFPIILRTATHSGSTSMLCRINQLKKLSTIKQLTQKSCCSFSRCAKSSKAIVQLATKSSGGMAASWNTVKPIFFALVTSWVNVSFHVGSNVFALVVERSVEKIKKKHEINVRKSYKLRGIFGPLDRCNHKTNYNRVLLSKGPFDRNAHSLCVI